MPHWSRSSSKGNTWSGWSETKSWECQACHFNNWGARRGGCYRCSCNPDALKKYGLGRSTSVVEPSYRTASAVAARAAASVAASSPKAEHGAPKEAAKPATESAAIDHRQLVDELSSELEHLASVSGPVARQLEADKRAELEKCKMARREENPLAALAIMEKRIADKQRQIDRKLETISEAEGKITDMQSQLGTLKTELDAQNAKLAEFKVERAKLAKLATGVGAAKEPACGNTLAKLAKVTESLLEGVKDNEALTKAANSWLEHLRKVADEAAQAAGTPESASGIPAADDIDMDEFDFDLPLPGGKFYSTADLDADLQSVDNEADPEKLRAMVKRLAAPARAATRHAKKAKQSA